MKYYNTNHVRSLQGVDVEGNSLWLFNHHQNLMVLLENQTITSKPNLSFQRAR
ncbi:hypothetical protein [Faecalibacter bovis]|uniref:Uncharacterized protein n=1 Tax=Faecalibacter bovis TaxID=2898187 RepID=A0ABX7XBX4_9FLAO|nr:hypothetical protein [Faecalibacter bovis]MBS7334073.1 hypothetical protein [Weeksellaceae bacterium]QTV05414.1 hypothetical protein J9309_11655 [Faecalibacter bovis]